MGELQGIVRFTFHPGMGEEFKRLSAECLAVVRADDDGTLQYDTYLNADGTKAVVLERFRDEAEWVNPGDPVLRIMQFDLLYCDGYVDAAAHDPSEVADRPVTVTVVSAQGERSVKGRIVYASQEVEGTDFKVRAEFDNQQDEKGFWLVRPGQTATITIHLDQPPVETAAK